MTDLVLSLFPGIDALGMAFELEGYCCVAGPDVVWGRDVRCLGTTKTPQPISRVSTTRWPNSPATSPPGATRASRSG